MCYINLPRKTIFSHSFSTHSHSVLITLIRYKRFASRYISSSFRQTTQFSIKFTQMPTIWYCVSLHIPELLQCDLHFLTLILQSARPDAKIGGGIPWGSPKNVIAGITNVMFAKRNMSPGLLAFVQTSVMLLTRIV